MSFELGVQINISFFFYYYYSLEYKFDFGTALNTSLRTFIHVKKKRTEHAESISSRGIIPGRHISRHLKALIGTSLTSNQHIVPASSVNFAPAHAVSKLGTSGSFI